MSEAMTRLVSFTIRRDRIRILAWGIALSLLVLGTAAAWNNLYPTQQARQAFASALVSTPAVTAFLGPLSDATTVGGLTSWRLTSILTLVLALVGIFLVVRHTRAEAATGRTDLLLSGLLTRRSLPIAALVPPLLTYAVFGVISWIVLISFGQSAMGALIFVAAIVGDALIFTSLALLAAGTFPTSRGASGATTVVTAVFFLVFVASNADSTVTWLGLFSPFGWASRAGAFATNNWWWVALPCFLTVVITIVAVVSAGRRDVGAALLSQREGRATGGTWLSSPLSLAWKVDRGLIYVWIGALTGLAVVVGILTKAATTLLNSSQQLQHLIERLGGEGNFANSYAASLIGAMSLATTAFAITLMLRIHDDEIHGRTELVLSTDVSRRRLLTARVVTAALSTLSIQVALGLAVGISYTVAADAGWAPVGNYLGVALLYTTAIWFMGAVALLLAAAIPRVVWIAWATFAYVVAMGELGSLLDLPTWMQATTPFWFVPRWPLEDFNVIPVMILILLSAMLVLGGYVGLRRRDIPA